MSAVSRLVGRRAGGRQLEEYPDRTLVEQRCQGNWAKATLNISSFMLICTLALTQPAHTQLTSSASTWHCGRGRAGQLSPCGGSTTMATGPSEATARHVIKRKRCLWPHVASSYCSSSSCCSVSILAWRMSSVAAAAAPAASYLQPLEGSGFLQREAGAGLAPRPCAAITRRRKHLNVFMWKLPSPRPSRATQATTKMFPLLS